MSLPSSFGPYRVVRALARGGMGAVLEVEAPGGPRLALKTLLPGAGAIDLERLRREAQALGALDHAHVVRVHAAELDAAPPWIVLDLLPGGSLEERLRRGPLPVREALTIAGKVARGVAHAHARGLLHRDLKPLNVLFDDRDEPRIVDFGLARADAAQRLTTTGEVLGTPAYMAPEQALGLGAAVDARTDVYGLGGVLFAALTARPPFAGSSAIAVLQAVIGTPAPRVDALREGVPPAVADLVARALDKEPLRRPADAAAFAAQVEALARDEDAPAAGASPGTRRVWLLGLGALLAMGLLALVALRPRPPGPAPAPPDAPRSTAPRLELTAPADGTLVRGDVVVVTGVVRDDGAWVTLRAEGSSRRVEANAPFSLEVALPPADASGTFRLRVRAQDDAGRQTAVFVELRRPPPAASAREAPWFVGLPPGQRPRDLPRGVETLATPGEYVLVKREARIPLVWVPPGGPASRRVARGFFIGKRELSWGEARLSGAPLPGQMVVEERPDLPVHSLVPDQAVDVCRHLGARLPTAAEWLWAALGSDGRRFPWGDEEAVCTAEREDPRANVGWATRGETIPTPVRPVGRPASASPFGCEDLVGNVAELLDPSPEPRRQRESPSIGGSWMSPAPDLHVQWCSNDPNHNIGLRIALTAE